MRRCQARCPPGLQASSPRLLSTSWLACACLPAAACLAVYLLWGGVQSGPEMPTGCWLEAAAGCCWVLLLRVALVLSVSGVGLTPPRSLASAAVPLTAVPLMCLCRWATADHLPVGCLLAACWLPAAGLVGGLDRLAAQLWQSLTWPPLLPCRWHQECLPSSYSSVASARSPDHLSVPHHHQ